MNEVNKHAGKEVFFLWTAFGDQQSHSDEGIVGDAFGAVGPVKESVLLQEP